MNRWPATTVAGEYFTCKLRGCAGVLSGERYVVVDVVPKIWPLVANGNGVGAIARLYTRTGGAPTGVSGVLSGERYVVVDVVPKIWPLVANGNGVGAIARLYTRTGGAPTRGSGGAMNTTPTRTEE